MKKFMGWFLIAVFILCAPALATAKLAPGDFIDIQGHWAENDIQQVYNMGLMNGIGTTSQGYKVFDPEGTVSRAMLVSVLQRTFKFDYGNIRFIKAPAASDYYQDVDDKAWYADALVVCAINKILSDSFCFNPTQPVNRLEVAQTIYKSFQAKKISVPMIMVMPDYRDTGDLSDEDRNAVTFVSNTGIMQGDRNYFKPGEPVKRAELARIISRCAQLMALNEDYNGHEYTVPVGETFGLVLNSNPTTGYQWNPGSWDQKIVSLSSQKFESSSNNTLVGQGGKEYFFFRALKPGSTDISLLYARPWESVQPLQTYKLKVKVIPAAPDSTSILMNIKSQTYKTDLIEVQLSIPQFTGLKNEQVQSAINEQFTKDAKALQDAMEPEARAFKKDCELGGYPFRPYALWSSCQKYYENGTVLSLYIDYYRYTGGAHGLTERRAYNYNLSTGEDLELKDLFQTGYDFRTVINEQIKKKIAAEPEYYFTGDMGFKDINEKNFYIENNCLVFYFNQYEIAPYAAGIREFRVPLELFAGNLRADLL